ncbi:MAG: hypothetical protein VKS61_09455 [Candidatus Sericytochromatia bacterium]|jgi:hypothetical protein|nr:hypothetical protein [Candidatus Sericytochromatia bacterium]
MTDSSKGPSRGTKRLARSENTERHVEALAKRIMDDPSFPLLHETARKAREKKDQQKGS